MALLLFAFWLALNARITPEVVLIGLILCGVIFAFICRFSGWSLRREAITYRLLPKAAAFAAMLLWEIVKANISVARIIFLGKPDPVVRTITTPLQTRTGRALLSNAITLTPGTITLLCEEDTLTVHCLNDDMARGLDEMPLEKRLREMEAVWHG